MYLCIHPRTSDPLLPSHHANYAPTPLTYRLSLLPFATTFALITIPAPLLLARIYTTFHFRAITSNVRRGVDLRKGDDPRSHIVHRYSNADRGEDVWIARVRLGRWDGGVGRVNYSAVG